MLLHKQRRITRRCSTTSWQTLGEALSHPRSISLEFVPFLRQGVFSFFNGKKVRVLAGLSIQFLRTDSQNFGS